VILQCKRFGFSLDELKNLLDLYDTDPTQVAQLSATLKAARRHHRELIAERDAQTTALADLEQLMDEMRRLLKERTRAAA